MNSENSSGKCQTNKDPFNPPDIQGLNPVFLGLDIQQPDARISGVKTVERFRSNKRAASRVVMANKTQGWAKHLLDARMTPIKQPIYKEKIV